MADVGNRRRQQARPARPRPRSRAHKQRIRLHRQPQTARLPGGYQVPPHPGGSHPQIHVSAVRLPVLHRQPQVPPAVAGGAPQRHVLGWFVADIGIQAGQRGGQAAVSAADRTPAAVAAAVRQRQPHHPGTEGRSRRRTSPSSPRRRATGRRRLRRSWNTLPRPQRVPWPLHLPARSEANPLPVTRSRSPGCGRTRAPAATPPNCSEDAAKRSGAGMLPPDLLTAPSPARPDSLAANLPTAPRDVNLTSPARVAPRAWPANVALHPPTAAAPPGAP